MNERQLPGPKHEPLSSALEKAPDSIGFDALGILIILEGMGPQKEDLIAAIKGESDDLLELETRYRVAAEGIIESLEGHDFIPAQIHLILHMGILKYEAGDIKGCLDELEDAHAYAWNQGIDELADAIDRVITELG